MNNKWVRSCLSWYLLISIISWQETTTTTQNCSTRVVKLLSLWWTFSTTWSRILLICNINHTTHNCIGCLGKICLLSTESLLLFNGTLLNTEKWLYASFQKKQALINHTWAPNRERTSAISNQHKLARQWETAILSVEVSRNFTDILYTNECK